VCAVDADYLYLKVCGEVGRIGLSVIDLQCLHVVLISSTYSIVRTFLIGFNDYITVRIANHPHDHLEAFSICQLNLQDELKRQM
jgi:hypothetical protein